ncbi:MAG: SCO family protein [Chitinophagaceae bacterium]
MKMHHYKKLFVVFATSIISFACKQKTSEEVVKETTLPFYNDASFTPEWIKKSSAKYNTIHTIPNFQFTNQLGEIVTEKYFSNKIYVANFFFTTCPGICKKLSNNLLAVQKQFVNDSEVLMISHSVTPEKDTVGVLQRYSKLYGILPNKWHLVTGNRNEIYKIARTAYFADEDLGMQKNETDFLHTENILLIDKYKRIRGVYKGTSETEVLNLIQDIQLLKKES